MKPKYHLRNLIGLGSLLMAFNCNAQGCSPINPDITEGLVNSTQDTSLSITRLNDRIPTVRWGEFEVSPVEVPADSKGAVVKRADAKGAMAPGCDERWEVFAATYWFTEKVDQQFPIHAVPESDIDIWGVNLGTRYHINSEWAVGGIVGYSDADVGLKFLGTKFAKIDVQTWSFSPFVNFEKKSLIAGADLEAQLQYIFGSSNYDNRLLSPPLISPYSGSRSGYNNTIDLTTGLVWNSGDLHHGPVVGLRYTNVHVDSFNLTGPGFPTTVHVLGDSFDSLASTLGYQVSYDIKVGGGKIVPTASAAWEHEFENDYVGKVVGGVPNVARDTAVVGAGIGWYGSDCCGWNVVAGYEGRFNSESTSSYVGLKVGKKF